jgi:sulfite exporter TauE/SafE
MMPMGLGMLTKGRMAMTPNKIKNIDQLHNILERAKTLEMTS